MGKKNLKSTPISKLQHKRKPVGRMQRIVAIAIAGGIILALLISTVTGIFSGPIYDGSSATAANGSSSVNSLQSNVNALSQALNANPGDVNTRLNLANAYYDLGTAYGDNQDKAVESYKKAVETYQAVLESKKEINIYVDMATAAFYAGENDIAEKGFKDAFAINPNFYNGLLNYGFFLMEAKGDYSGAMDQWDKALKTNPSPEETQRLNNLIEMAKQRQLDAYQNMLNGSSAPNTSGGK